MTTNPLYNRDPEAYTAGALHVLAKVYRAHADEQHTTDLTTGSHAWLRAIAPAVATSPALQSLYLDVLRLAQHADLETQGREGQNFTPRRTRPRGRFRPPLASEAVPVTGRPDSAEVAETGADLRESMALPASRSGGPGMGVGPDSPMSGGVGGAG